MFLILIVCIYLTRRRLIYLLLCYLFVYALLILCLYLLFCPHAAYPHPEQTKQHQYTYPINVPHRQEIRIGRIAASCSRRCFPFCPRTCEVIGRDLTHIGLPPHSRPIMLLLHQSVSVESHYTGFHHILSPPPFGSEESDGRNRIYLRAGAERLEISTHCPNVLRALRIYRCNRCAELHILPPRAIRIAKTLSLCIYANSITAQGYDDQEPIFHANRCVSRFL